MVVLSLEEYASLTDNIEMKLDEADRQAAVTDERLSHESVFKKMQGVQYMENKSYSLRYLPIFETDLLSTINYITNVLKNESAALRLSG